MIQCKKCNAEFSDNVKFCTKCGEKLERSYAEQPVPVEVNEIADKCYLIDFFKNVFRTSNIPVIIYLGLNVLLISIVAIALLDTNPVIAVLCGLILYLVSLAIALSPIGEWILRFQTGCRNLNDCADAVRFTKLYEEILENAQRRGEKVPKGIKLYVCEDECPNAFATGRKTICITKGMMRMSDGEIKATLAHELGHLCHHDTDLILVISIGNLVVSVIILGIRIACELLHLFVQLLSLFMGGDGGFFVSFMTSVYKLMFNICVSGFVWVWTKLGILLVMKSSRENEFEADLFAAKLGYKEELITLLRNLDKYMISQKGLFANLASSHPSTAKRIARLCEK